MEPRIRITPEACFLWGLMLLTLPFGWLISAAAAAAIHEGCHLAVLKILGGDAKRVTLGAGGTVLEIGGLSLTDELLCAAAGPAGSLLLVAFRHQIPMIALCGLFQGLYNLLPVYPLDGGRILRCGTELLFGDKGKRIAETAEVTSLALLAGAGIAGWIKYKTPLLLALSGAILTEKWLYRKKFLQRRETEGTIYLHSLEEVNI